jgi:S-adenosylmethionine hydrolase
MSAIITLTTDFGLADAYVAAMKGVILTINPEAKIVDICHNIKPQNVSGAAFVLSTAYRYFPRKTIHVVVVDPGVGTERRAIILRTPAADFVAPDNGVLSYVMPDHSEIRPRREMVAITNQRFWRSPVSATFHGRDIFAPVAAHLSLGASLADFGEKITSLKTLPLPRPQRSKDGSLIGHIIHVDSFGNLITDVRQDDLPRGEVTIEAGGKTISGLSRTYAGGKGLLALIGSGGYLEVALREGSAGAFLNAHSGDEVIIKTRR